jgi:hypothetical protein
MGNPKQLSSKLPWELANPLWSSVLNPIIKNPINSALIINQISLVSGTNVINHGLSQIQRGWFFTDINAAITAYRSAPFNDLTLTLTCSGPAIANLAVF